MQPDLLIAIALIFFVSAAVYTFSGFGYSLIAIPLLTMILPPRIAVPLNIFLGIFLSAWLIYATRGDVNFKNIGYLLLGMVPGVPFGSFLLANVHSQIIILTANGLVVFSLILFAVQNRSMQRVVSSRLTDGVAGFLSGFLGSGCGIAGPPVILLGIVKHWDKREFRANLIWYFALWGVYAFANFFAIGLLDNQAFLKLFVFGITGLALGIVAGSKLNRIVPQKLFSRICTILILLFALLSAGKTAFTITFAYGG